MSIKSILFVLLISSIAFSCSNEIVSDESKNTDDSNEVKIFNVTTDSLVLSPGYNTMGNITVNVFGTTDQKPEYVIRKGVCFGTKKNPTLENNYSDLCNWNSLFPYRIDALAQLLPNTSYHLRIFVETIKGIQYGNNMTYTTTNIPLIVNPKLKDITQNNMNYEFRIATNGGAPILSSGIVWSKIQNPAIELTTKVYSNSGSSFDVSGSCETLERATKYYARCFATNKYGTGYSEEITFYTQGGIESSVLTDVDGNQYRTIQIGNQIWMAENLRVTRFRNGEPINTTSTLEQDISNEFKPTYQWPSNGDETTVLKHGRLYTWYTVVDSRKIAPEGWRVPTEQDFAALETYLIMNGYNTPLYTGSYPDYLGKSLASTTLWELNSTTGNVGCDMNTNNLSGFNAYPTGIRDQLNKFNYFYYTTTFWSTNQFDFFQGWGRQLCADYPDFWNCYTPKYCGLSVRCIKEEPAKVIQVTKINTVTESTQNVFGESRSR